MTILSCWWRGASGIACANDANVKAKASAINLVIASLQFTPHKEQLAKHGIWFGEFEADQESVAIVASMPRSVSALSGKADMVPCRAPISRRCRIWVRNGHPQDSDHCPLILVAPHFLLIDVKRRLAYSMLSGSISHIDNRNTRRWTPARGDQCAAPDARSYGTVAP